MKRISLLFIAVLMIAVYSCAPSVEGETKSWDSNVKQLKKMQTDYPAYSDMIGLKITEAERVYNSAKDVSDEEAKAKKMREANNLLTSGCIGDLKNMSSKIKDVENKKSKLKKALKGRVENDIKYAEVFLDDAKSAIKKAERVLNKKAEDLDANPCFKIEAAFDKLERAYKEMDETISSFKDADSKKEAEVKKDEKKKEEAVKDIKCEYCGSKNKAGTTKCKSCGANL